jgi:hypothetical protein
MRESLREVATIEPPATGRAFHVMLGFGGRDAVNRFPDVSAPRCLSHWTVPAALMVASVSERQPNPSTFAMRPWHVNGLNLSLVRLGASLSLKEVHAPEPGPFSAGKAMIAEYPPDDALAPSGSL